MFEQVKTILARYTDAEKITEEAVLTTDLGLSSFDLIAVITDFEETFQIEISDRDICKFISVKDILEYLLQYA